MTEAFVVWLLKVRVFTFLIGRELGDLWQTRWMACSNKGTLRNNVYGQMTVLAMSSVSK